MQMKHMVHNVVIISIHWLNFALSVYISTVSALLYISKTAKATSHFTLVFICGRWALWFYCPTVVDLVRVYAIWLQLSGRNDTKCYEPDPTWRLLAYQYIVVFPVQGKGIYHSLVRSHEYDLSLYNMTRHTIISCNYNTGHPYMFESTNRARQVYTHFLLSHMSNAMLLGVTARHLLNYSFTGRSTMRLMYQMHWRLEYTI